ncbi:DNA cytosine methyltransferase [Nitrospirillum viridazoti]|uniref:DNA (cytosine-5-)-methyltransferase n=1 Tax=Nitrospirillum amazonense TaxID=28077 RepID=A0A560I4Q6_9PROT|nr:DNA (cytosine-5-)-methyltransferase [Nitrospirillum amazonense]TWB52959.1 DNA (cytosine-5)-methyltransferase 1 [Nitrospirillum amazonense]
MISAELFAGCGGLALGMSRAGFKHTYMAEFDRDAVETVLHNKQKGIEHVRDWPMGLKDVREIDWKKIATLDLVSGGPPCQPFGIGGKKLGQDDHRDMWPEAIRAIREATPRMFLFENVRNLAGPRFQPYLNWITASLERPALLKRPGETHEAHLARLNASRSKRDYRVAWQLVNAADYGAAQIRHRVLIFGIHADLNVAPAPMDPTHSRDRLLWDQFVTGEYWKRHRLKPLREALLAQDRRRVVELRKLDVAPATRPWLTVRDALLGLGEPDGKRNHVMQPGARVYPGHTGSPLDLPAKALKAGDHGVPGGENMMVRDDGSVRYFTTREAARLVGLPDEYEFPRSWTESMRQLGNAVPAQLGAAAGAWLAGLVAQGTQPPLVSKRQAA